MPAMLTKIPIEIDISPDATVTEARVLPPSDAAQVAARQILHEWFEKPVVWGSEIDGVARIIDSHFPPAPAAEKPAEKPAEKERAYDFTRGHLARMLDLVGQVDKYLEAEGCGCYMGTDRLIDFLEGAWIHWTEDVRDNRQDLNSLYAACNGVRDQRKAAEAVQQSS